MTSVDNTPDDSGRQLNRALPGSIYDQMRFGVKGGRREVYGAVVSAAMSACLRGWTRDQFVREISDPDNQIWAQLTHGSSRATAIKTIRKAWDAAVAHCAENPCRSLDEIRIEADDRAFQWTVRLVDNNDGLTEDERAVMAYVISEVKRRGFLKVTCPCRAVAEFSKLPPRTAYRVLQGLASRGMLIKHSAGRRQAGPTASGRAAVYELPDPGGTYVNTGHFPMCQTSTNIQVCSGPRWHLMRAWLEGIAA